MRVSGPNSSRLFESGLQKGKAIAQRSGSFSAELTKALDQLNKMQHRAEDAAKAAALGNAQIHDVMIALEEAEMGLRLAVEVRNRAIEAYQEIMRMPV